MAIVENPVPPAETLPARSSNGKHPGGRPTKRTPEVVGKIAEAISYGLSDADAAAIAEVDDLTITRWRKIPEFCRDLKKAEAHRKLSRLKRIDSGEAGWGTAWCMERQYPQEWSRPELRVNVEHSGGIEHQLTVIADTELRRMSQIRCEIEAEVMAA